MPRLKYWYGEVCSGCESAKLLRASLHQLAFFLSILVTLAVVRENAIHVSVWHRSSMTAEGERRTVLSLASLSTVFQFLTLAGFYPHSSLAEGSFIRQGPLQSGSSESLLALSSPRKNFSSNTKSETTNCFKGASFQSLGSTNRTIWGTQHVPEGNPAQQHLPSSSPRRQNFQLFVSRRICQSPANATHLLRNLALTLQAHMLLLVSKWKCFVLMFLLSSLGSTQSLSLCLFFPTVSRASVKIVGSLILQIMPSAVTFYSFSAGFSSPQISRHCGVWQALCPHAFPPPISPESPCPDAVALLSVPYYVLQTSPIALGGSSKSQCVPSSVPILCFAGLGADPHQVHSDCLGQCLTDISVLGIKSLTSLASPSVICMPRVDKLPVHFISLHFAFVASFVCVCVCAFPVIWRVPKHWQ